MSRNCWNKTMQCYVLTPFSPPMRCVSSTTKRLTFWTFFRCFQRRDRMSHLSGVLTMMSPFPKSFRSVLVSPVSSTTFLFRTSWNFWCQSTNTWETTIDKITDDVRWEKKTIPALIYAHFILAQPVLPWEWCRHSDLLHCAATSSE